MKKVMLLVLIAMLSCGVCYADIFKPIGATEKLKATENLSIPGVDPGTILAEATQVLAYLGPKDGPLLDKHGYTNYASATIVTYDPWALALNAGVTGSDPVKPDGGAFTLDFNVGKFIPAQNVPILQYVQNGTIGVGCDYRRFAKSDSDPTESWSASACVTAQIKATF